MGTNDPVRSGRDERGEGFSLGWEGRPITGRDLGGREMMVESLRMLDKLGLVFMLVDIRCDCGMGACGMLTEIWGFSETTDNASRDD